jgi:hypothetical protein
MKRFLSALAQDVRDVIKPVIFLFVMFELVAVTNWLLLESYSITPTHTVFAAVGALIGGKAILVANKLPYLHIFRGRPVLLSVVWRSLIYALFCALFLCSEHILTGFVHREGPLTSLESLTSQVPLPHVAANAIWLFVSLLLYNSYVEVDQHLGPGTLRGIFLGSIPSRRKR